jgi:hypothetical protein
LGWAYLRLPSPVHWHRPGLDAASTDAIQRQTQANDMSSAGMGPEDPRSPRRAWTAGFGRPEKDSAVNPRASSLTATSTAPSTAASTATSTQEPEPAPAAARPSLRLVPGDRTDAHQQLPLALDWEVSPGVPAVPPVPADLRIVADATTPADLPEPGRWVAKLARAIAEVSVGERPPGQLTRWVSRPELSKLTLRASYVARHPSACAQRGVTRLRTVRAVRICPVAPGIIEASAVLVGTDRAQAIAMRIEAVGGRWLATAIDMR